MRPALLLAALLPLVAACALRHDAPPPSPHCRTGDPLAGVYHPKRLKVKSRCRVATGTVDRVKFEEYDGDVHILLRLDRGQERLLSHGNDQLGGMLVVELIPQDRARVPVPDVGERVTVVGPWVEDHEHGDWNEIHPAWSISSGRIVPASPLELDRVRKLLTP